MDHLRAFIAVEVPDPVKSALRDVVPPLQRLGADIKWTSEEQWHITLHFLGNMAADSVPRLVEELRNGLQPFKAFRVSLGGFGAFPSLRRPSVLWVGVSEGVEELTSLQHRVSAVAEPYGDSDDRKSFHPHITIGRVRSGRGLSKVVRDMQRLPVPAGSWEAASVVCMQSVLTPQGPVYTALHRWRLSGAS